MNLRTRANKDFSQMKMKTLLYNLYILRRWTLILTLIVETFATKTQILTSITVQTALPQNIF